MEILFSGTDSTHYLSLYSRMRHSQKSAHLIESMSDSKAKHIAPRTAVLGPTVTQ